MGKIISNGIVLGNGNEKTFPANKIPYDNTTSKLSSTDVQHAIDELKSSSVDASKLTGTIDLDRLPQGALERCVIVADDTARFKLTKSNIQTGDTVKVTSTSKMYFVVDDSKLNSEAGYEVYTAGSATSVPWSGVTGKPNYAGSSSAGGSATSAVKLDTATAGSATQPVYFKDGKPVATTYTLGKSVPSDAKFTDTTYGTGNASTAGLTKLYTGTGTATDGTMTQNAIKSALDGKLSTSGGKISGNLEVTGTVKVGACTLQYDSTNKCVNFVF